MTLYIYINTNPHHNSQKWPRYKLYKAYSRMPSLCILKSIRIALYLSKLLELPRYCYFCRMHRWSNLFYNFDFMRLFECSCYHYYSLYALNDLPFSCREFWAEIDMENEWSFSQVSKYNNHHRFYISTKWASTKKHHLLKYWMLTQLLSMFAKKLLFDFIVSNVSAWHSLA